jgi:cytochrome bd-type quinol oxidase subunit 1
MSVSATVRGVRDGQKRVLRLQRRLWLAEMAVWPAGALLFALAGVGAWVVWQRRSRERGAAAAAAAPVHAPQPAAAASAGS